jgi:hypothetical protein
VDAAEEIRRMVARLNAGAYIPNESLGENVMAKPVRLGKGKEFHFATSGRGGGESKYPWDEWFSPDPKLYPSGLVMLERSSGKENDKGTIVEISEKRDYEVSTDAMPPKIKTAARRRYKVVEISRKDAEGNKLEDALIIRARDMTADEKQEENVLRAEEKAEAKAKRGATPATNGEATEGEESEAEAEAATA